MHRRIVGDDHVRVEQARRIEQFLERHHDGVGLVAPFQPDKRRHIAAGAVLGLERAAEFDRDQLADRIHEVAVALHLGAAVKARREDEVQVAFQGVAEDQGFGVAEAVEEGGQAAHALGQMLDRKGYVLDHHRGADRAHRTHGRKQSLAHRPVGVDGGGVGGKAAFGRRGKAGQQRVDGAALLVQPGGIRCPGVDQQGGSTVRDVSVQECRQAGLVLHSTDAAGIDQLNGFDRCRFAQGGDGTAAGIQIVEQGQ